MAYFEKRVTSKGIVRWRAQIRKTGQNKTFRTLARAREWALQIEAAGERPLGKHTLLQAMRRYAQEVSPTKRGGRWERIRLAADPLRLAPMAHKPLAALTATDVASWRNRRLLAVSGATVRREMNLIDSVLEVARKEWKWLPLNPMRDVDKPASPPARRRRIPEAEITAVTAALTGPAGREVAAGFLLGIETAMRAGEMWSLERPQIDLRAGVAHLLKTKNGDERDVALTPAARDIIKALLADKRVRLFTASIAVRDALFRKAVRAAGVVNLHFHDSRAEAIWRLSKLMDPLELARQVGHRDPKSLLFYYRADAAAIAARLATGPAPEHSAKRRPPTSAGRKSRRGA